MERRDCLRGAAVLLAAGASAGASGCLGATDANGNENVALPEPDRRFESSEVAYPAWGERVPGVSLSAPLEDGTVSLRDLEEPFLTTFFYSYCRTTCPVLMSNVRNVQTHAVKEGYGDDVGFYPITFDPERDTPGRLEGYAEKMNVDTDAGNWHFLRPESKEEAERAVFEEFGVTFRRTHPEDMDRYMFTHTPLTLLVNADGYVERAYRTESPDTERMIADLEEVREA